MNQVSKVLDNYILDKDEPFWYVQLNNGETIYQDDFRSGLIPSAWDRLQSYCRTHELYIERMWIRFRSNVVEVPQGKEAYWFKKGILAGITRDMTRRFRDINFFVVGYVEKDVNILYITKWRIPELIDWEKEEREIPEKDIIWKNGRKPN